jgi:poly(3-hydroxybutyrate) depolymerase
MGCRLYYLESTLLVVFLSIHSHAGKAAPYDSIPVDGKYRKFVVHAPTGLPAQPPLVLVIHGLSMAASLMETYSQFDKVADREKFVAVYPEAIDKSWDMTGGADVTFLLALVDTITNRYGVDRNRIYSTGFSQGGFMSHILGSTHADKFAAIAPVAGGLSGRNIKPARPMPVLHIHGDADSIVAYSTAAPTIKTWVEKNGCPQTAVTTKPYPSSKPDSKAVKDCYGPCNQNSEVILITLGGVGHAWATGGTKYDISAPEEIWAFFKNHSLDATPIAKGSPSAASTGFPFSARYERGVIRVVTAGAVDRIRCTDVSGNIIGQWSLATIAPQGGALSLSIGTKLPAGVYLFSCFGIAGKPIATAVQVYTP